jgi:hypothetical protein
MDDDDELDEMDAEDTDDDQAEPAAPVQQEKPQIDMEILAQKVFDRLVRELLLENERIGR